MSRFFCRVAQSSNSRDFSWVVAGMGNLVEILHVEADTSPEASELAVLHDLPTGDTIYLVYHTGPPDALQAIAGKGFIRTDSTMDSDGCSDGTAWDE